MYITQSSDKKYHLSAAKKTGAVCEILPPVIVIGGKEKKGTVSLENARTRVSRVAGLDITDRLTHRSDGIFRAVRRIVNNGSRSVRFKSVFEIRTMFVPTHFVFPGFNYDITQCGGSLDAGIAMDDSDSNFVSRTPVGLEINGSPWVFAYDREGIPSASLTEDDSRVCALFASDESPASLLSSSSMIRNPDGSIRQRVIHPVSEMPYTYAQKNTFEAPYETYLTLKSGDEITLAVYVFAGEPKYRYYGTAALMEACTRVFPFSRVPELSPEKTWDLGMSFFRFMLYYDDGVPMFATHISDRLYGQMHSAKLRGEALAKAMQDPENRKLNLISHGSEIGWAGQGAMVARMYAIDGFRRNSPEDVSTAERCLDAYASTQRENGLLFPRYGQRKWPEEKRYQPDACNMGWAMCEFARSYRLFKEHGKIKRNYYDFAVRLADFAIKSYNEQYGFPKAWKIDGTVISTGGSVGGFLIMGLCEVHRMTGNARYLDAAVRAMDFYYRRDLDNFICCAGALDCACVDKESAYPFLNASLYLYETTKDRVWLERAEKAAYYFFSWMFFYDCLYDDDSDFSKYGYHTTGGTLISAEHSALDPWGGLLVGELMKLWHYTGNVNFRQWARMTWWNALLGITTENSPDIHGIKRPLGSQNEGFFHCRWTKYRPTCEERGHFNDHLILWMVAYRMHSLSSMDRSDIDALTGK